MTQGPDTPRLDPHENLGAHEGTDPNAHFTISREFSSFLSGIALDEFTTSADRPRISDGFGDELSAGTTDFI